MTLLIVSAANDLKTMFKIIVILKLTVQNAFICISVILKNILLWCVKAVDGDTFYVLNLFLFFFSPSVLVRTKENITECH